MTNSTMKFSPSADASSDKQPRRTRASEAVRRAVREAGERGETLDADGAWEAARVWAPGLGRATVYRTLRQMHQNGELRRVWSARAAARYEVAGREVPDQTANPTPCADQFECRHCGRAFDLQGARLDVQHLELVRGFVVETRQITLHGLCSLCASAK